MRFFAALIVALIANVSAAETEIIGVALTPATGITRDRFNAMAAAVAERFEGGARVTLMLDGQAGTEEAMAAALRRGRIHFGQLTIPGIATAVPEMAVLMAPYLFDSFAEEDFVLDGYVVPVAKRLFAERGLELFGFSDSGWFIAFAREAMPSPEAARGRRLRAAGGDASRLFLAAVGADVVELAFADLIPALQTGMVRGGVTNLMMYDAAGLVREAPHVVMTRHALNPGANAANKAWFDGLSPANQKLIQDGLGPMSEMRAGTRREMDESLAKVRALGATIYEPTPEEVAAWRERGRSTHAELVRRLGGNTQELYDAVLAGKAAFAARVSR